MVKSSWSFRSRCFGQRAASAGLPGVEHVTLCDGSVEGWHSLRSQVLPEQKVRSPTRRLTV